MKRRATAPTTRGNTDGPKPPHPARRIADGRGQDDRKHLPDTERLEKRFDLYTKMTATAALAKGGKRKAGAKHPESTPVA